MAGDSAEPAKALEFKEKGNKCFQAGNYTEAEALYTKAINYDPDNPLLYTNRTLTLLRLRLYTRVVSDALTSIALMPENMKAYYHLAQAHIALGRPSEALASSRKAHAFCVEEIHRGGKGASSIGPITELVLRCKKEDWEEREDVRLRGREGLLGEVVEALGKGDSVEGTRGKIEEVRRVFDEAGLVDREARRRKVPDWCVDDITFAVMLDPVVTKTGQSYDRSSIMEHLKRSPTDPLTREPLRIEDLRPNLALKAACEEFIQENGWAVDW
ncbi:RING-type E3 ubiquitin transferase CHIP [Hyphodiscus hymeniophilus]|uniref:RING-type E3 ubiquitin transferase CHIP n=1 Tax=Hyphodiscus hymeniophilus TaxID=353542 RepID=A0A9P7AXY1_9HELO|nr:RING-type E3 ubiquitin transferase CHIP [Hyphodiscus hymeniophilus]